MPKRKVSSSKSKTSGRSKSVKKSEKKTDKKSISNWLSQSLRKNIFLGLSLSGGKADKTCLSVIEFYPEQGKLFLSRLENKIKVKATESSDLTLVNIIKEFEKTAESLSINAPLTFPKCIKCRLKCPGYEKCTEPEIEWMWENYKKSSKKTKLKKLFTPYTERCVEQYITSELEEPFYPSHAFGANMAPLTARAHFLKRRIKLKMIEAFPKLSLWRIGRSLAIQKSYLRTHKHAASGMEARLGILNQLVERDIAFIYEQDFRTMVDDGHAFDAFVCGLTGVLKFLNQCERRPKGFPRAEGWIEIPKVRIDWQF